MSEWIKVSDRLPKKNELCITSYKPVKGRTVSLKRHYEIGFGLTTFGQREADLWMPLPKPPEDTQ